MTNATRAFCLHNVFLCPITARLFVINEAVQHRSDRLQLSLHSNSTDFLKRTDLSLQLYLDDLPHLRVAILDCYDIVGKSEGNPLGQDVIIVGSPLGFHDAL